MRRKRCSARLCARNRLMIAGLLCLLQVAPGPPETGARAEMIVTDEDRKHWSYLPVQSPPLPKVKDGTVSGAVDRFVQAKLEGKGLALSPRADGRTVVR